MDTNSWPFAQTFFMFRAGGHSDAIEYLDQFPEGHDAKIFGSFYRRYLLEPTPSLDEIAGLLQDYSRVQDSSSCQDMYRDALINLMTGNAHPLPNETLFWEVLVPPELET